MTKVKIIDGKQLAEKILDRLGDVILQLHRSGRNSDSWAFGLAAILIGDDPGLKAFVKLKKKAAESVGLNFASYEFSGQAQEKDILATVDFLNRDDGIRGIFVELPVPQPFNQKKILDSIVPAKDVDVLSSRMQELYYAGKSRILPPAVRALEMVFTEYDIKPNGKRVAVFGNGFLVGRPIAYWLRAMGAGVDVIDEFTANPASISTGADIVVSGVGVANLVLSDMIKDGAVVIDYGYSQKGGQAVGDVDFAAVFKKTSLITPVPGGMGPLVVAAVLENMVNLDAIG